MCIKYRGQIAVNRICALFGVSKQAYYSWLQKAEKHCNNLEAAVVSFIQRIRVQDPNMGGRKLWVMYQKEYAHNREYTIGRDRFYAVMRKHHLMLARKAITRIRTTDSSHNNPKMPNLVKSFIPTACNQLWVSDITYIPIIEDDKPTFCYLSLITDAYSKKIVGYQLLKTLDTSGPLLALKQAFKHVRHTNIVGLIHHSDRGAQYTSKEYTDYLRRHNVLISMTESGNPRDNAEAERINETIKCELLGNRRFYSFATLKRELDRVILFYNTARPHSSLNMMTPEEATRCTGEIKKQWYSYRLAAIKRLQDEEKSSRCSAPPFAPSGLRPSVSTGGAEPKLIKVELESTSVN